ncbi:hypothetical protein BD311DRAFT_159537 [Dichomitus squalens]|uniref:Secreted protein n=1 Tax=Dichomitus squalens TaxID=114155 RepID=A0A4Q9MTF3_9APHY|nr:hypothetical protein BD311DRAFT_159537 [Dichomitus squalens]
MGILPFLDAYALVLGCMLHADVTSSASPPCLRVPVSDSLLSPIPSETNEKEGPTGDAPVVLGFRPPLSEGHRDHRGW